MMSAQMLASADTVAGTVSDLAPGAKDGMRMLEARAVAMNQLEEHGGPPQMPPPTTTAAAGTPPLLLPFFCFSFSLGCQPMLTR